MIGNSRSRQKHSPAFALILAVLFSFFASVAHAGVVYDFTAESSFFGGTGSFRYTAPDFITSNTDVPAASLDSCASPAGTCGTMQFFADSSVLTGGGPDLYDAIGFTVDLSTAFYYFDNGIFSTPGSFATVLFGEQQAGRLTVSESGNVPEPAPLALISIALVALCIARKAARI